MRKLQINDSGAWRQVLSYNDKRDIEVRDKAAALCAAANPAAKLRTVDAETGSVLLYWESNPGWYAPAFVARREQR